MMMMKPKNYILKTEARTEVIDEDMGEVRVCAKVSNGIHILNILC